MLACKVQHPNCVHLNRGNHETRTMARFYGFDGEVRHKYDDDVLEMFHACFVRLPLCCVLHKRCLVVHGGLPSEDQSTLKDIRKIERRCEPPELGLFCDVLWSDPQPKNGCVSNKKRGAGCRFGPDPPPQHPRPPERPDDTPPARCPRADAHRAARERRVGTRDGVVGSRRRRGGRVCGRGGRGEGAGRAEEDAEARGGGEQDAPGRAVMPRLRPHLVAFAQPP